MRYVYIVIYYTYSSLHCKQEYENEIFSSFKKAKSFMRKIVEQENRSKNDNDFYFYKIEIIKKEVNVLEEDKEARVLIYDLEGELLHDSFIQSYIDNSFTQKFHVGDIVRIIPYPWSIESCCEIEVFGVVSGYYYEEYLVYVIQNYEVFHLHAKETSLEYIDKKSEKIEPILKDIQNIILKENNISDEDIHIDHILKI